MPPENRLDDLTTREREVLDLVRLGLTNEEIAGRLGITEAGAKYHVSQILSRLGVSTREEAAAVATHVAEAFQPRRARWWAALPLAAKAAGVAVMLAAVGGLGLLAWGVLRTSDGDSAAGSSDTESPIVTATVGPGTSSGWSCYYAGLYDTSLCRLPSGDLVLSAVGATVLATEEERYPTCPESWTANDAARLCLPPNGWRVDVQNAGADLSSSKGAQVIVGPDPFNVLAEKCDPVYVFGIVLGPLSPIAEWCVNLGDRYAHISVPAGLPAPDYYEAFQVALSAGG